jgi:poly(hydroxyalkanoate) depolymerase family esterase
MLRWLAQLLRKLRTGLLVRVGVWRGRWHYGKVHIPHAALVPRVFGNLLAVESWRYGLYQPSGLADGDPAPLIVLLHGCRQSALRFAVASGWTAYADRARVRLLCPLQRRRANSWGCWNWFTPNAQSGGGELKLVLAMLDDVATHTSVDAHATAAVGLSAGGALAALLAFHHADRVHAAVVVAAPPVLGPMNVQDPRDVMKNGLWLAPKLVVAQLAPCAALAVIQGQADEVVNPRCAEQLIDQALQTQRHKTTSSQTTDASMRVTDYRAGEQLVARQIIVTELKHEWTGGPGGHAFCERGGAALVELSARFLKDAGFALQPAAV